MNKLNFYIAFIGLLVAISILEYISDEYRIYVKIIFHITAIGFVLKMVLENFEFSSKSLENLIIKTEKNIFYIITWLMLVFLMTTLFTTLIQMTKLQLCDKFFYIVFGGLGGLSTLYIKRKDNNIY